MQPFMWVLILCGVAAVVVLLLRKRDGKEQVVQAKVSAKQAVPHKPRGNDDDSLPTDYVVTFQVLNKSLPLIVNRSFFDSAQIGAQGKLTFKKDVFVEFEDDNPRIYR
ncbi:DUF2500 family protein [Hydrogenoanaerobacterium sp.]|uniref:DUF2500 family protein n=1 Tax=Hydrogenoanaerobacterium sp. TaxID=2953763 RepID=UPI0028996245|nr:DUF2500 family protein [Hydrogenoanaerobacterium sp.]